MRLVFSVLVALSWVACKEPKGDLPILGDRQVVNGDTIYHKVGDFRLMNQDSQWVDNNTFKGKAYIVDFFFVACPTICPKVARNMKRVHDKYLNNNNVLLLAHTVDTKHDSVPRLRAYAEQLDVKSNKWHFVTGSKEEIYSMADDYFSVAIEDPEAPGGFDHSGRLILVDKNRQVRSFCDGTNAEDVDRFMLDVDQLLLEQ